MPSDASSLHCPNCGAAVDPEARRCPYCTARLATVSCPSCFALMFDTAAFCPGCGTPRSRSADPAAATVTCPGCGEAMPLLRVGATEMFECAACDGLWVDAATFERLCASSDEQAAVLHQFSTPGAVKTAAAVRYRKCARCGQLMNRVNFGRLSGVIVDACRGHGTYLDAGELHRIVTFIESGGLVRARARQLEELKEQERRVADAGRRAARERGRSDAQQGVGWHFLIGE
jgi:Zn-finger nucleic acid-binding protein